VAANAVVASELADETVCALDQRGAEPGHPGPGVAQRQARPRREIDGRGGPVTQEIATGQLDDGRVTVDRLSGPGRGPDEQPSRWARRHEHGLPVQRRQAHVVVHGLVVDRHPGGRQPVDELLAPGRSARQLRADHPQGRVADLARPA
jgi:hypothetical protein